MKKVAIQGYRGCFHEQASREFYSEMGEDIRIVECPTFESLFKAMEDGAADAAVMAIENTISGGLIPNFELLRSYPFRIKGEVYIRIEQNLMALPGQRIEDIRQVRTHYMAINQTRKFFEENCLLQQAFVKDGSVSVEQYMNTAAKALGGSVKFVSAVRFEKGEGIEKKQEDFAAEVAAQMNMGK